MWSSIIKSYYTTYDLPNISPQKFSFEFEGEYLDIGDDFFINTNSSQNLNFKIYDNL